MSSNKKNHYLVIKFFIIFFSLIFPLKALEIKIVDGDTIHINKDKIRFSGIDAPELNQTCLLNNNVVNCGKISKELFIKKIANNIPNCIKEGIDQYKRILAECFVNNKSLSSYLVRNGYAFAYRKYSKKFIEDEEYAQKNNLGMWAMKFDFPWDFRKKN